ncbi:MAG: hypothetical protein HZB80_09250 [Deltaproteobacteria bacterium]|nr:hypothetical protein [Deltaproteobacteria bacterium]
MSKVRKFTGLGIMAVFLFNILLPVTIHAEPAVAVMTLANGTSVSMTSAQLAALAAQPGMTIAAAPIIAGTQMAIPLPAALGGGYLIGTPVAIASGMGATGVAAGATAAGLIGGTVAAGTITAGALAGTVATLGVAGTVTAGAIVVGTSVAVAAEALAGGATTSHHH